MANDMMKEKWGMTFLLMDVNHDGIISSKDRDDCKAAFQTLFQPEGEKQATMNAHVDKLWDIGIFLLDAPDWSKMFTKDEFIQTRAKAYEADKNAMVNAVRTTVEHMCKAADINGTGSFTHEEFVKLHKAFGIDSEEFIKGAHGVVAPDASGSCAIDNVIAMYTELIVGEDPDKHEMCKALFKASGFM